MNEQLLALLTGTDPSVPLAAAALVRSTDADGQATLSQVAVAYREAYLELMQEERGGAALSVEEANRHLRISVLPRLETEGLVELVPDGMAETASVRLVADAWGSLTQEGVPADREIMGIALDALRKSEAVFLTTEVPISGSELRAQGLTKTYRRRRVVDHVDVALKQGEIVGLLGPNGAGKTTTFYMMVGLVRPEDGRIYLDDVDISTQPMYRRARAGIGYLAQEPSIFRKLTVEDNVLAILETLPLSERDRTARLDSLLDDLSIKHLRGVKAFKLSGGERRRLEITRALVTGPKFMLLDEPFAGVDPIAVSDIQTIVASLRRRGIGVLITDHNVEQTLDIVDRAYIMFDGKVQVSGTVRELVFNERVADLYLGPTLTSRLRERLGTAA